jgi:hypothetical protein
MQRGYLLKLPKGDSEPLLEIVCDKMPADLKLSLESNLPLNLGDIEWIVGSHDDALDNLPCLGCEDSKRVVSLGFLEGNDWISYLVL